MRHAIIIGLAACAFAAPAASQTRKTILVGYLENAIILPSGMSMKAKMDTGARTTSINAVDIERFKVKGEEWVRFTVKAKGRKVRMTRKVYRISRIRRTRVGVVERPVVLIGICLAGYYKLAQVNLTDRSNMSYPLLIGRRFMATGRLAIDSAAKYVGKPVCAAAPKKAK